MINGTGVDYPTIELGGKTYTVKFSRGMLYRMGKLGVVFAPKLDAGRITMDFAQIVDLAHLATGFKGTHDELAELLYDKRNDALTALMAAWGKAFPPSQTIPLRETAGQEVPKQ